MRVLIVTEGSKETGLGHVSRMQVLVRALDARGAACYAWMVDPYSLGAERWKRGDGQVLSEPHWLKESWGLVVVDLPIRKKDNTLLINLVRQLARKNDVALVLGRLYDLPQDEQIALRELAKIIIEQDENHPEHWLIDPRFAQCVPEKINHRALVIFGGTDPHGLTESVLEALSIGTDLRLATTKKNQGMAEWERCRRIQTDSLADAMSFSSVYVGAVGMTAMEACAAGLPSVLVSWTPEHARLGRWLAAKGAAVHVGLYDRVEMQEIVQAVNRVRGAWDNVSRTARQITDGRGAERVAEQLVGKATVYARMANKSHLALVDR